MIEHRFAEDRRQWIIGLVMADLQARIGPELEADARQSLEEDATAEEVENSASMIAEGMAVQQLNQLFGKYEGGSN